MSKTIPFFSGACILLALALCVGSCSWLKQEPKLKASVNYCMNGEYHTAVAYEEPFFPTPGEDIQSYYNFFEMDSNAAFDLRFDGDSLGLRFIVRSDTSFFREGGKYYLDHRDFFRLSNTNGYYSSDCVEDSSWCAFSLPERDGIKVSLLFDFLIPDSENSVFTSCSGKMDIYRGARSSRMLVKKNNAHE